nr:DUF1616 domain-containing protein [Halomarina rubra]
MYLGLVNWLLASNALGAPGNTLRIVLTLPLVVFVPGYALAAAAFPRAPSGERRGSLLDRVRERPSGIDTTERLALGLGLSLTLLPIVGVLVAFQPGPMTAEPAVVALSGVAALFTVVAAIRRWRLSAQERYGLPLGYWNAVTGRSTEGSRTDVLLSVGLGVSVVLALLAGGFAITSPQDAQRYTTFSVGHLDETGNYVFGSGGELSEPIERGSAVESAFYVQNNEQQTVEYTVVIQVQKVDDEGNVVQTSGVTRYRQTLEPGEEWINPHRTTISYEGENVRLAYLLYKGPITGSVSMDTADDTGFHALDVGTEDEDG